MSARYLLRRLAQVVPAVAGILIVAFVVIHAAPGDPWWPSPDSTVMRRTTRSCGPSLAWTVPCPSSSWCMRPTSAAVISVCRTCTADPSLPLCWNDARDASSHDERTGRDRPSRASPSASPRPGGRIGRPISSCESWRCSVTRRRRSGLPRSPRSRSPWARGCFPCTASPTPARRGRAGATWLTSSITSHSRLSFWRQRAGAHNAWSGSACWKRWPRTISAQPRAKGLSEPAVTRHALRNALLARGHRHRRADRNARHRRGASWRRFSPGRDSGSCCFPPSRPVICRCSSPSSCSSRSA